ncbi:hypothetical protein [Nonomuraea fuscirosea]|uniref:hypothetical protein n=1 Tax=Nonomuraea fuscirosea TaxID=1291556 RepID=UPI0034179025
MEVNVAERKLGKLKIAGLLIGLYGAGIGTFQVAVSDPVAGPWFREQAGPWFSTISTALGGAIATLGDDYSVLLDDPSLFWWANPLAGLMLAGIMFGLGVVLAKAVKDVRFGRYRNDQFTGWLRVTARTALYLAALTFFVLVVRGVDWYYTGGVLTAAVLGVAYGIAFTRVLVREWGGRDIYRR